MISEKAYKKLPNVLFRLTKESAKLLAVTIAANNVLITDITKKGELVVKHLN
jgi:hypothetical protein